MAREVREYFGFRWVYIPVGKLDDDCEGCWRPLPWGTPRWRRETAQYELRLIDLASVICIDCQFGVAMADWYDFVEVNHPELFKRLKAPVPVPEPLPRYTYRELGMFEAVARMTPGGIFHNFICRPREEHN